MRELQDYTMTVDVNFKNSLDLLNAPTWEKKTAIVRLRAQCLSANCQMRLVRFYKGLYMTAARKQRSRRVQEQNPTISKNQRAQFRIGKALTRYERNKTFFFDCNSVPLKFDEVLLAVVRFTAKILN